MTHRSATKISSWSGAQRRWTALDCHPCHMFATQHHAAHYCKLILHQAPPRKQTNPQKCLSSPMSRMSQLENFVIVADKHHVELQRLLIASDNELSRRLPMEMECEVCEYSSSTIVNCQTLIKLPPLASLHSPCISTPAHSTPHHPRSLLAWVLSAPPALFQIESRRPAMYEDGVWIERKVETF